MAVSDEQIGPVLIELLTAEEREGAAVYAADKPIPAGTVLHFARTTIEAPWDSLLFFVDRDPWANWTHSCRYLLISRKTGEAKSFEAQTPPFGQEGLNWRVVYRAASVPEAVVPKPQ